MFIGIAVGVNLTNLFTRKIVFGQGGLVAPTNSGPLGRAVCPRAGCPRPGRTARGAASGPGLPRGSVAARRSRVKVTTRSLSPLDLSVRSPHPKLGPVWRADPTCEKTHELT